MKTFGDFARSAKPRRRLAGVLLALALAFNPAHAADKAAPKAKAAAEPAGDVQNGKKLYHRYGCYQCHGYAAQGGLAGPRLAPSPTAFAAFRDYVRQPAGSMPPYTLKVTSDQELADVYAYMRSLPAPPSARSTGLLSH